MATENITISKDFLLNAYRKAEPSQQEFLKKLFGPDKFAISFNVMDRIKTFQDAVDELGNDNKLVQQYNQIYSEFGDMMDNDIIAYLKLRIITAALNEGWEPQYTIGECRYYPYFYVIHDTTDEGMARTVARSHKNALADMLVYANAYNGSAVANTSNCMRLTFKTKELAEYAGKQFLNIWADFVYKGVDHTNQHE